MISFDYLSRLNFLAEQNYESSLRVAIIDFSLAHETELIGLIYSIYFDVHKLLITNHYFYLVFIEVLQQLTVSAHYHKYFEQSIALTSGHLPKIIKIKHFSTLAILMTT